jgi:hypothetical protein
MTARPSKGTCTFSMAMQIDRGNFGALSLDGLGFIVVARTPEEMAKGGWSVGLVVDQRATDEQRDAIAAITSGGAGGPMAAVSGLVGTFLGVERAPITFERTGLRFAVKADGLVDMAAQGVMGIDPNATEPMHLDRTGHPASDRLALARATKSHVGVFGLTWDDISGRNNGHYAPFSWKST